MNNNLNRLGGVHFEEGRGYRASLTIGGFRIRSQRFRTKKEANRVLDLIRNGVLNRNGSLNTSKLNTLEETGMVSVSVN